MSPAHEYRLVDLSARDAARIAATDALVWFSDTPGATPEQVVARLELDRTRGVQYTGPVVHPVPEPAPLAGVYSTWTMGLSVPGADGRVHTVDANALTWVGVHPDHRRRGVLRSMITDQLSRARTEGHSVAILHASEPSIYGRFGYAVASIDLTLHLARGTEFDAPAAVRAQAEPLTTQILPAAAAADAVQQVHARTAGRTLGAVRRNDHQGATWWVEHPVARGTKEPLQVLLAHREREAVGYAVLRRTAKWNDRDMPDGTVSVWELGAEDSPALLALARRLVDLDLTASVEIPLRSLDDPLLWWTAGPRPAGARAGDSLWVRLVDLPAALTQRGYASECAVMLEVTDDLCTANAGRWELRTGRTPSCTPTEAEPDLVLDISTLAAAYLGGRPLAAAARAGLITQNTPRAVASLSRAMRADTDPYGAAMF